MANASEALNSARTYLNDVGASLWTDAILLPYLKEAFRDLLIDLYLNGIPVIREKSSSPITVAIGALTLTLPSDFLEPIKLKERLSGSSETYIDMVEKAFEPDTDQTDNLRFWAYREEAINFVGATTARQILLFYWKTLTIPTAENSLLGFIYAEIYLGPKTAAYAAASVGNITLAKEVSDIAEMKLDKVMRANIKGQQSLPVRRIPYRRGRGRRVFSH